MGNNYYNSGCYISGGDRSNDGNDGNGGDGGLDGDGKR